MMSCYLIPYDGHTRSTMGLQSLQIMMLLCAGHARNYDVHGNWRKLVHCPLRLHWLSSQKKLGICHLVSTRPPFVALTTSENADKWVVVIDVLSIMIL